MLSKYTTEEYRKLYKELPQKVKNIFWEDDVSDRIEKIVERHELSDLKERKLIRLVAHIYLGLLPPKDIRRTVSEEIDANPDDAEKITNDINRLIVFPTKHLLKEIYKGDEEDGSSDGKEKKRSGDAYREAIE